MKKVISILIAAFMLTALLPVSILASSDVEATVSIGEKSTIRFGTHLQTLRKTTSSRSARAR